MANGQTIGSPAHRESHGGPGWFGSSHPGPVEVDHRSGPSLLRSEPAPNSMPVTSSGWVRAKSLAVDIGHPVGMSQVDNRTHHDSSVTMREH